MTNSPLLLTYLSEGTHAARPTTPNVPIDGIAIYFETDTLKTFLFDSSTSAWVQIGGSGSGGQTLPQLSGLSVASFTQTVGSPVSLTQPSGTGFVVADHGPFGVAALNGYGVVVPGSTPWTLTVGINALPQPDSTAISGLFIRDTAGKLITLANISNTTANASQEIGVTHWNNNTSFNSGPYIADSSYCPVLRVVNDGTNFTYLIGFDGYSFIPVFQEGISSFLGTIQDVGFIYLTTGTNITGFHPQSTVFNFSV